MTMLSASAQEDNFIRFLQDSVMINASVSFEVADADSGNIIYSYNPDFDLIPASTMKLITSAAALEMLGPLHTFKTELGYRGVLNNRSGRLTGDIIIKGGGDPCLGSEYFSYHYGDFIQKWVDAIKDAGIKKIEGRIIADDSYFDYEPVPPRWLWEDMGVSYGAGVFGLSAFDNICRIKLKVNPGTREVKIIETIPELPGFSFKCYLQPDSIGENWYVLSVPYSTSGWLSGTIPWDTAAYILDASIPDPPLLIADMLHRRLASAGIKVSGEPSTARKTEYKAVSDMVYITETSSPLLSVITERLNKESINLYAEHFLKEMGKQFRGEGTNSGGLYVIRGFLSRAGIDTTSLFLEDGSGLSSRTAISANALTKLLIYMKHNGKYFNEFLYSLPEGGSNGTLSKFFTDQLFQSNLRAKSGSMTRVRCYAGYFSSISGKNYAFSILVNNFRGGSPYIINNIEAILKDFILYK